MRPQTSCNNHKRRLSRLIMQSAQQAHNLESPRASANAPANCIRRRRLRAQTSGALKSLALRRLADILLAVVTNRAIWPRCSGLPAARSIIHVHSTHTTAGIICLGMGAHGSSSSSSSLSERASERGLAPSGLVGAAAAAAAKTATSAHLASKQ